MKNLKKGFIVPLLLIVVALLLVGGGVYVYMQKNQGKQALVESPTTQATSTTQVQRIPTPITSVGVTGQSSTIFSQGYIKNIYQQNNNDFVRIHAIQFVNDASASTSPDGYRIIDLNKEADFQVATSGLISFGSDALTELIQSGILPEKPGNGTPYTRTMTLLFSDLLNAFKVKGAAWNGALFLHAPYNFSIKNGQITEIHQIYIP